jgi:hypothetical protein
MFSWYDDPTALPFSSLAGVKRTLALEIRQVASSSVVLPLDDVTEQSVTRPSVPIVSFAETRP